MTAVLLTRPWHPALSPVTTFAHRVLERMLEHFFPEVSLFVIGDAPDDAPADMALTAAGHLSFNWLNSRYGFSRAEPFSVLERLLIDTIVRVLRGRIHPEPTPGDTAPRARGSLEDRCVAAFLASSLVPPEDELRVVDTLVGVMEGLRRAAVTTHENRRVTAGALVGAPTNPRPLGTDRPLGVLRYEWPLASPKTVHRICDGLRTVALVDHQGGIIGVRDLHIPPQELARPLPYPIAARYAPHAGATVGGRQVCLVLNAHGTIHVFAHGVQTFSFIDGRWRLRDLGDKVAGAETEIGSRALTERLLRAALTLSEHRRGALFVVLNDAASEDSLMAAGDSLSGARPSTAPPQPFHELLRGGNVHRLSSALVENIASIDGAVVLRRNGDLIAAGAILRGDGGIPGVEGARTTAAFVASQYGAALKVSEDGEISLYRRGARMWTL
jgi:DNA integrity scanning protein DisA with diadenylate cyclase activity